MNCLLVVMDHGGFIPPFPQGLAYIATSLEDVGCEVAIYNQDVHHYSNEHLTEYLNENKYDIVAINAIGGYYQYRRLLGLSEAINKSINRHNFIYIIGGHCSAPEPEYFLKKIKADICVLGEGDKTIKDIANSLIKSRSLYKVNEIKGIAYRNKDNKVYINERREEIKDIDNLRPAYHLFPIEFYRLQRYVNMKPNDFIMPVLTCRGCWGRCLQGDSIIETLELGRKKIKDLVGKNVNVLTRNKTTKNLIYASAKNISIREKNSNLVRVHFDNNTYIDCTPDHKFLAFRNGGPNYHYKEWEEEAQNLKPKQSVKAIRYQKVKGYEIIRFGKQQSIKKHILMMENVLKRKLTKEECIHHIDKVKDNNIIDNLLLTTKKEHTVLYHQEEINKRIKYLWSIGKLEGSPCSEENKKKTSKRMKKNNPMKNKDTVEKVQKTLKKMREEGLYTLFMCSDEGKKTISEIAKKRANSDKNPLRKLKNKTWEEFYGPEVAARKKEKLSLFRKKYRKEVNHKVVKVEKLPYKEDTYCMEVPGYDWFFANNVLVHNCKFCFKNRKTFVPRHPSSVIKEVKYLQKEYNINVIDFSDELLMSSEKRAIEFCEYLIKANLNIRWHCNGRLNFATTKVLKLMKRAGCIFINYGVEAMDNNVLKLMNKGLTTDIIIKGVENTLKENISPGLNMMWNSIGDTIETLDKAVEFLLKYDDCAQLRTIRFMSPYPGSQFYYDAIKLGLIKDCEDFYKKHKNSDLMTVNFMKGITEEEANLALYKANCKLINNYYSKHVGYMKEQARQLYLENNEAFRGFRRF